MAFSLIEMVTVMATLTLLLALVTATLLGTFKSEKVATGVTQRLLRQQDLADQFREDVTGAVAAPASWTEWTAGPTCLILRKPSGRYLVYRWNENVLQRLEDEVSHLTVRPLPLGSEDMKVEFLEAEPGKNLFTLRLLEKRGRVIAWQTEITAALGGDFR